MKPRKIHRFTSSDQVPSKASMDGEISNALGEGQANSPYLYISTALKVVKRRVAQETREPFRIRHLDWGGGRRGVGLRVSPPPPAGIVAGIEQRKT